jgi:anti-anti-sigma regulatory factor
MMARMFDGPDAGVRIDLTRAGAMAIVAPHGELDPTATRQLSAAVQAALAQSPLIVAIDLRGVTVVDGGAITSLIEIGRQGTAEGRRMLLVRGPVPIDLLISDRGLDGYFDVVDGPDQLPSGEPTDVGGLEPV